MTFERNDEILNDTTKIVISCQFIEDENDASKMRLFSCNWSIMGHAGLDLAECGDMTIKEAIAERLGLEY